MGSVSFEGESYEEWLQRTAPQQRVRAEKPRRWDLPVLVLVGVFFAWVGGAPGWVGLGVVALLAAEQGVRVALGRPAGAGALSGGTDTWIRGATLLVALAMCGWLVTLMGGPAWGMPVLVVLLDLQDPESFLRWAAARVSSRRPPR
jgi:hypothetical protein